MIFKILTNKYYFKITLKSTYKITLDLYILIIYRISVNNLKNKKFRQKSQGQS